MANRHSKMQKEFYEFANDIFEQVLEIVGIEKENLL
ncbi:hypothetical protein SAMN05660197_1305 [Nitratiruptor tergarcus DSM 16512]|uniref:Uncharacterized protein n=1 Tax=Nitratiruptor tergarcus DSM 16512 TaxID=1069081 RepID=A0A1W1WT75_9BACT|nr:hypothetical protein SAMN05660197_1305 [Nitratiruptor tergarcus DSM 16512]